MIRMKYDPIMGVRYEFIDDQPATESQRVIVAKLKEKYNRTRHIRAKQMRRANNQKQK